MNTPPEQLIVSLHIPKTGGTTFGAILEQTFPGQVAYLYKAHNRRTHPLLRGGAKSLDAELLRRVEEDGARVVHGHGAFSTYAAALPDPSRYWTWLRDPVERVISSYFYHLGRSASDDVPDPGRAKVEGLSLEAYARERRYRNQQSRILAGAPLEALGFVGVTERFEESLSLLGFDAALAKRSRNVNHERPAISDALRRQIAEWNSEDLHLHARANALLDRRLAER